MVSVPPEMIRPGPVEAVVAPPPVVTFKVPLLRVTLPACTARLPMELVFPAPGFRVSVPTPCLIKAPVLAAPRPMAFAKVTVWPPSSIIPFVPSANCKRPEVV